MLTTELKEKLHGTDLDATLARLYGERAIPEQKARYIAAVEAFEALYGAGEAAIFSVPGRSEVSGNHTDHNRGRVIAAAINLDIIAVARVTDGTVIRVKSEGFPEDVVDFADYNAPREDAFFTSGSIIAGMCDAIRNVGGKIGGFDAYTTSNVFKGSGLSSSAAFEVMIGNMLNHFYNGGTISNVEIAKMAQYAENVFFGKPCGLMDQTACAVGGFVEIDFEDPASPVIEQIPFDLAAAGYSLCIVNTGGNHADLNEDYASVPAEMKGVAQKLGREVLRGLEAADIIEALPVLREECGDRAVLRALHFIAENDRVPKIGAALKAGDLDAFFRLICESGNSSFRYLQNVYTTKNVAEQGLSLALCLAEQVLSDTRAAWRVHGGGFAGTIQAFVPDDKQDAFCAVMDAAFAEDGVSACHLLSIRPDGAIRVC